MLALKTINLGYTWHFPIVDTCPLVQMNLTDPFLGYVRANINCPLLSICGRH